MRSEISFELVCSECGHVLEAETDKNKTKIEFGSAFKAKAVMAIKPCGVCYKKALEPAKLIKEAFSLLDKK